MFTVIFGKMIRKIWQGMKIFYQAMHEAKRRRAMYYELNRLSDYELRDMGISRSEIIRLAYQDK